MGWPGPLLDMPELVSMLPDNLRIHNAGLNNALWLMGLRQVEECET
jgi:hypothetical protein